MKVGHMATKEAIARMEGQALARLRAVLDAAAAHGVEPVTIPTRGRDAAYLRAAQLAAFAEWAEAVLDALSADQEEPPAPEIVDAETDIMQDEPPAKPSRRKKSVGEAD